MKISFILISFVILYSCVGLENINQQPDKDSYLINRIENKNSWHIIFANRNDSTFMIVSKKAEIINTKWEMIKVGTHYNLKLSSIIPVIDGVKMIPINYLDFEGINLDDQTIVNINPEKGIYDIYEAKNLRGLYLIK